MSSAVDRVKEAAARKGFPLHIHSFSQSTKSASEAAEALGVSPGQIGKSLLFLVGERPLLCIASGLNQVDEEKISRRMDEKARLARAREVRELTGFSIGGVPPVGHSQSLSIFIDADLMKHDEIYCAAGTPHAVFPISPKDLEDLTGGEVLDMKRE